MPFAKDAKATCCHVCEKAGENRQIVESHNFRDQKGRVVCQIFLQKVRNNKCQKCDQLGHFTDKCPNAMVSKAKIHPMKLLVKTIKNDSHKTSVASNSFSALENDDDILDEIAFSEVAPNVTVRSKRMMRSWADMSDDDDEY